MSSVSQKLIAAMTGAILLVVMPIVAATGRAEEPISSDQILHALMPLPMTRSLSAPRPDTDKPEQTQFLESLRSKPADAFAPDERQRLAAIADTKPAIDLSVNFAYNSDKILPATIPQVRALGQALASSQAAGNTFVVAGHTDGAGNDQYNQKLSERRAEAVKSYLVEHHGVPAANLIAVGYGRTRLKIPSNPLAPENRRVQIVNVTAPAK
jgi:outer membrane protein OmpA-like peptidoglycan-associated protein